MKNKVVYADPPWARNGSVLHTKTGNSCVDTQYDTMSDEELLKFPINDYADKDCILFMWVTIPKLDFGIELLKSWGFDYKTSLVWKKEYNKRGGKGLGTYFMIQTEIILMGIRGNIPQFHSGKDNFLSAEWRGHSVKPQQFRTLIENVTKGLEPRIELWGRIKAYGWNVFGNDEKLKNKPLEAFTN